MGSLLVHITHGPEAPTRAALGFLVAKTAVDEGHEVSLFLAGDAVQLVREAVTGSLTGIGTGALSEHVTALVDGGVPIFCSGMSAKARGMAEEELAATGASFAMPAKLVELIFAHDRVLTY
ncbi:MAG TPA: DsrE family protein [Acidimicrobiales bacterium]|nr:DsrE family protein [Acidimicrobiales bacterium]